jgi:hypothetical protein
MKRRFFLIWLVLFMASFAFYGCGGGGGGGAASIGIVTCYNCHADGLLAKYANENIFSTWLYGPHGNYEGSDGQDHGVFNDGYPAYATFYDDTCQSCHDPEWDGRLIENLYLLKGVDYLGRVNRPIVGCESCHGGGEDHFGSRPVPYAKPDAGRCGLCHSGKYSGFHLQFRPEAASIYENYIESPHAKSVNEHTYLTGSSSIVRAGCSRCHTDEGARLYLSIVSGTETKDQITSLMEGRADISGASPVQCRTCHNGHDPLRLLGSINTGLPSAWSVGFKTCVSCHQIYNADGTLNAETYHDPVVNTHGSLEEIIVDTHYDDPATQEVEGYILNPTAEHSALNGNANSGACEDCHNPHMENSINNQWAVSGHGGDIAGVKEAGGRNAGVTDADSPAWTEFDFKAANRQACQRCHTATGFRNFANSPATFNPASSVFIATSLQKELLYCWACHIDNKGGLRDPGVFAVTAPYTVPADRISSVPDLGGSNICMACHSGRESGQELKNLAFPGDIAGKNFGTFNSHYLAAGGVLFRTIGYEFEGRDYLNAADFKHDIIGTGGMQGTGLNGPCVGCHMRSAEGHKFLPVTKDEAGLVTDILTYENTCSLCHSSKGSLIGQINNDAAGYDASLTVIEGLLALKGIYFGTGHPYFFNSPDPAQQTSANAFTAWPDKDMVGAAFNLNLLRHMPGADVHNGVYTKKLIYDTIDFLDDSQLNFSVGVTLGAGAASEFLSGTR